MPASNLACLAVQTFQRKGATLDDAHRVRLVVRDDGGDEIAIILTADQAEEHARQVAVAADEVRGLNAPGEDSGEIEIS